MPHLFIRIVCFAAVGALVFVFFSRYAADGLPIGMLFWGVAGGKHFARDTIEIIPAIAWAARRSVFEKWSGRYYTFDGAHIRFYLVDETVWIVEEDVRKIITPAVSEREQRLMGADYAQISTTRLDGYSEHALCSLLKSRMKQRTCEQSVKKFYLWLENEAIPNVKRLPSSSVT